MTVSAERRQWLAGLAAGLALSLPGQFGGAFAMGGSRMVELKWEWPAERTPAAFAVIRVARFEKDSGGLFGIRKSPSIAGNLPDARMLRGDVLAGDVNGAAIELHLPGPEVGNVKAGDLVGLALVDKHICICAGVVPGGVSEADALEWTRKSVCNR